MHVYLYLYLQVFSKIFITSAKEVMFTRHLSVCLLATTDRIFTNIIRQARTIIKFQNPDQGIF